MTSGLVDGSFSLPEWQAVKMISFAPCLNEGPSSIKPAETGNPTRVSVPPPIPLTSKNSEVITKKMMFCSHFIIVCDYNGINEGKQFSLLLSLSLCFCGVLKAEHCSDDRLKLFILCWKLPCSGQLDKGLLWMSAWCLGVSWRKLAIENLHIWCRWSICQYWGFCNIHTAFLLISHNDIPHVSQNGLTT